jgi:hypothetical protein
MLAGISLFLFAGSRSSDMLVASSAALSPEWIELHAKVSMQTTADWSEVFIEIPGLHEGKTHGTFVLEDEAELSIEGYLVPEFGDKMSLDQVGVVVFGSKPVLRLSNSALEWKGRNYKFKSLFLRAKKPLNVSRVIWLSYDPRSTRSGVMIPHAFQ